MSENINRVSTEEVQQLLQRVGDGEIVPKLKNPEIDWENGFGEIEFIVDGWEVVVYNDCFDFDYVDKVITPDGRTGEFDDWHGDGQPDDWLCVKDRKCCQRMVKAFMEAK